MTTLFTIGYEQASIGDFVATLCDADVACVLDVRAVPVSRKPGFSKSSLQRVLANSGIGYIHIATLGNPPRGRDAAKAGKDAEFRQVFEEHLKSSQARRGLADAASHASRGRACLLCFERDARHCHRLMVAQSLQMEHDFVVRHLTVPRPGASGSCCGSNGKSADTGQGRAPSKPAARGDRVLRGCNA
ncbi:MAG: DUF488 family protein [Geminicoccaceae bacterium]